MGTTGKIILTILGISLLTVFGVFAYKKFKGNRDEEGKKSNDGSDSESENGGSVSHDYKKPDINDFPLKKGVYNSDHVKFLQHFINRSPKCRKKFSMARISFPYPLKVDGDFGKNTEASLLLCSGARQITKNKYERMRHEYARYLDNKRGSVI